MAELCAWSKLWCVEATERDGYRCARDLATGKLGLSIERGRRQSAYSLSTLHCFHTPRPLHIRSWLFWSRFVLEVSPISPQSVFKSRYDRLQVIHGVTVKGCQCELWKEKGALKMTDMKLQDMKLTDRVAGHEIAGHGNGGPNSRTWKCKTWNWRTK